MAYWRIVNRGARECGIAGWGGYTKLLFVPG